MRNVTMRADMRVLVSFLAVVVLAGCHGDEKVDPDAHLSSYMADLWLEGADVIRILWRDCSKKLVDVKDVIDHKEYFPKFVRCMKRKTLRALDRSLGTDVVPVTDGVNLVRYEMLDRSGNVVVMDNETSSWTDKELDEGEWRNLALQRMAKVLRTHVIKIDVDKPRTTVDKVEYRGRRRHQMMTMMMFGIVSIGMVLIPMGFQFLAVLGGKALLLAKMALILASIQGLKKIAASPLNYGFYHYPPYDHLEKRAYEDWPPPSPMPGTPPPALSRHSLWPDNLKRDRLAEATSKETKGNRVEITYKSDATKKKEEPRLYPVFMPSPVTSPASDFASIDAPIPLDDLTTRPGEVQADYSLDLPYNGFRFQSPTPVVSA